MSLARGSTAPPAVTPAVSPDVPAARDRRRTLGVIGLNHALHDGYTDLIYVLLPVWQGQFGLDYASLALLRTLYTGALAALQVPSTRLAEGLGARAVLVGGTALSAGGYALAGLSGGLAGLCAALVLAGAGGSTQHPLASAVIARAYGRAAGRAAGGARGALGIYNFAGDLGKAALPPLVGLMLGLWGWHRALWAVAGLGAAVALGVGLLLPLPPPQGIGAGPEGRGGAAEGDAQRLRRGDGAGRGGFGLLVAIGVLDTTARPAFLLYLPFLLGAKGAALATVGLAFALVGVGGALGRAACGRLGSRFGVVRTVVATEVGTAGAILLALALPLGPALALLPALGLVLSGTSSVLYGTVPELAPGGRVDRAFALFYTFTLGVSALAVPLLYGRLGDAVGPAWAAAAAAATALAVVPLVLALSPRLAAAELGAELAAERGAVRRAER